MIDYIPPATIGATSGNTGSKLNGIDILTSIQILLVQDYDDQLQSLGNQIKGTTKVKQAYRKEIEALQNFLIKPNAKGKDGKETKGDDAKAALTTEEESILNGNQEYFFDPRYIDDPEKQGLNHRSDPTLGKTHVDKKPVYGKGKDSKKVIGYTYEVKKKDIETKIEQYKQKLETLNEQSELMSLGLQSLSNQRKIAFETISNLINKEHEGIATIVRNIKS